MGDEEKRMEQERRSFIKEQIAPKKRAGTKKLLRRIGTAAILAVVFGLVSGFVLVVSMNFFSERLEDKSGLVEEITGVMAPSSDEVNKTDYVVPDYANLPSSLDDDVLAMYENTSSSLAALGQSCNRSIVAVLSLAESTDWFQSTTKARDEMYGLCVRKDANKTYFLTYSGILHTGDRLRIRFPDGEWADADIVCEDSLLNLGVVSVWNRNIPETTYSNLEVTEFDYRSDLNVGTAVLTAGNPNGIMYTNDFGRIKNAGIHGEMVDGNVELYNTDILAQDGGYGVVFDFQGKVIGLLTKSFEDLTGTKECTFIGAHSIESVLSFLIRGQERLYTGMKASQLDREKAESLGVKGGLYISELESDSPLLKKGARNGDVILSVQGKKISDWDDFNRELLTALQEEESQVKIQILQSDGKKHKLEIPVG